jgi:hypothetical protein
VLLILVGFALRFGLVLRERTYLGSANTMTPFGAEICRIAWHIAAREGFRSPFHGGVELTLFRAWWFWDGTSLRYQANEWWSPWEFWPLSAIGWLGLLFVLTRRPPGWLLYAAARVVYAVPYYFVYPQARYPHAIGPELLLLGVCRVFTLCGEIAGRRAAQTAS